jgi:PAS domain S-box-containing protein
MLNANDAPCGLCRLDADGRVLEANAELARLVGGRQEELIGRNFAELLTPSAKVYHQLVVWPAMTLNRHVEEATLVLRGLQDADVHVLVTARRHESRDECRFDLALFAMKERKVIEDRLLEAQRTVDQLPGLLFRLVRDPNGRYRLPYASNRFYRLFGGDTHGLFNDAAPMFERIHPGDRDAVLRALDDSRSTLHLRPLTLRLTGQGQGQALCWVRVHASVQREPDGTLIWQGSMYDVTQQQLIDERLREVDKLQAVATLAAGVAHDFNNVLGSITGLAELCGLDAEPGSVQERNLERIAQAAGRAAGLVRRLLDFSRASPRQTELICLGLVLQRSVPLLAASLPPQVRLTLEVERDTLVHVDPSQIEQSLLNLVSNAAYAMRHKGGTVRLVVDRARCETCSPQGDARWMARLSVIDHGEGISAEAQQKLFEPFFTTKPVGEGTGLGLAAVHGVITGHGGHVLVDSQLGSGTAFHLLLPCAEPAGCDAGATTQDMGVRGADLSAAVDTAAAGSQGELTALADCEPPRRDAGQRAST